MMWSALPVTLTNAQSKIKTFLWNFLPMRVVYIKFIAYIRFLITLKFWIFSRLLLKTKVWVSRVKIGKIKHPRQLFCRMFNFASFGVFGCVYFKTVNKDIAVFWPSNICRFFWPKERNKTLLKCQFLKYFWTDFSDILVEDVKLILNKVLNVSRRILP